MGHVQVQKGGSIRAGQAKGRPSLPVLQKSNTSTIMFAAIFAPPPLLGENKNLSSFPPDANLDLVDLFHVFFKPSKSLPEQAT